jgi:multiple sugar transport system permease protein
MTARSIAAANGAPAMGRAVSPSFLSRIWHRNAAGYLFLLPWLIGFFGLTLGPA